MNRIYVLAATGNRGGRHRKEKGTGENGLKKKAKIEILLPRVEKEMREDLHKGNNWKRSKEK